MPRHFFRATHNFRYDVVSGAANIGLPSGNILIAQIGPCHFDSYRALRGAKFQSYVP